MATLIYLGNPPPKIKEWIEKNYKPAANPLTKIAFADGTIETYDIQGEISRQKLIELGIYVNGEYFVYNELITVEIGSSVTSISDDTFNSRGSLKSITIPNSVTSIGDYAFFCCTSLKEITIPDSVISIGDNAFNESLDGSVTFEGKTIEEVQNMDNYPWGLDNFGSTIHCINGSISV